MRRSRLPLTWRRALGRLTARQHGLFTRAQARAAGCSDSALYRLVKAGEAERVFPGVFRFTAAPRSWKQRAKAATLYAGERAWLSHRSAAYTLGMIQQQPGVIEIISERDLRSQPGLKVRRGSVPRSYTTTKDDMALTNSIRTMVDLASVQGRKELEFALDHCLFEGLVEVDRVQRCVDSFGTVGRRRTRVLRDLLAVRGEGLAHPLSVLEQQLLAVLRDAGIEEPDKQVPTTSDDGEQWRLDFVYPQHKVHIEVDGRRYHAGRTEQRADRRRDNFMNTEGWIVLRFTWEDVMNDPGYVVEQVLKALGRKPAT